MKSATGWLSNGRTAQVSLLRIPTGRGSEFLVSFSDPEPLAAASPTLYGFSRKRSHVSEVADG
jgi:hypothetical protein